MYRVLIYDRVMRRRTWAHADGTELRFRTMEEIV